MDAHLRTTFGLRTDVYQFSVTSNNSLNSGDGSDALVSPKLGAIFGPWRGTELYANAGMGFHSNDARGATITRRSDDGEPADRVTPLVRARRRNRPAHGPRSRAPVDDFAVVPGSRFRAAVRWRRGTTEAGRPSRRIGVEWTNYARLTPWLTSTAISPFHKPGFAMTIRPATNSRRSRSRDFCGHDVEPQRPLSAVFASATSVRVR